MTAALSAGPGPDGAWDKARAGAWPLPHEKTQAILKVTHSQAPKAFDASGGLTGAERFEKTETEIDAEHGWRESVTLLLKPVFQDVRAGSEAKHGLASIEAGARARLHLFEQGGVLSTQASLILPGGKFHREHPLLTSGHADVDGRLLYGEPAGLLGLAGYTDMQLAYRHRGGAPADEMRVDVTYGLALGETWALAVSAQTISTVGTARPPYTHFRSSKFQGSVRYALGNGRHLEIGALRALSGAATVRETGVFISVWSAF